MTTGGGRQVLVNIRVTLSTPSVLGNAALLVRGFSQNGMFHKFSRYIIDLSGNQLYGDGQGGYGRGQGARTLLRVNMRMPKKTACFDVEG
jgi:hypothetical protein